MSRLDSLYLQQRYFRKDLRSINPKLSLYEKINDKLAKLALEIEKEKATH